MTPISLSTEASWRAISSIGVQAVEWRPDQPPESRRRAADGRINAFDIIFRGQITADPADKIHATTIELKNLHL
jgi:hypothetical protein